MKGQCMRRILLRHRAVNNMADDIINNADEQDLIKIVEDGKEYVFEELDRFELDNGKRYIAIIPLYEDDFPNDDEDDGNVIILEVIEENGEQMLVQIEDEKTFNEVGNIFEDRLIEKYENDEDTTVEKRDE